MLRREQGFTLLEICMAVMIALLIIGMAVPSVRGVLKEQELKKSFEDFDDLARKAQNRAIAERRAFVLIFEKEAITLEPYDPKDSDEGQERESIPLAGDQTVTLERPAAMEKKPAQEWIFWRSGVCEPAIVNYEGKEGTWRVEYNALTGRGTFLEQNTR